MSGAPDPGALDPLTLLHAHEDDYAWEPSWKGVFLRGLRSQPNVSAAARLAGITRQGAYQARAGDVLFAAVWDDAVRQSVDLLAGFAHRMSTTGLPTQETRRTVKRALDPVSGRLVVVEETEVTVENHLVSPQMAMFLLRAHDPAQYVPPERRELSGPGGVPVQHEIYRQPDEGRVLELARIALELEAANTVDGEAVELGPGADGNGSGPGV
jgi:hypothetical protein